MDNIRATVNGGLVQETSDSGDELSAENDLSSLNQVVEGHGVEYLQGSNNSFYSNMALNDDDSISSSLDGSIGSFADFAHHASSASDANGAPSSSSYWKHNTSAPARSVSPTPHCSKYSDERQVANDEYNAAYEASLDLDTYEASLKKMLDNLLGQLDTYSDHQKLPADADVLAKIKDELGMIEALRDKNSVDTHTDTGMPGIKDDHFSVKDESPQPNVIIRNRQGDNSKNVAEPESDNVDLPVVTAAGDEVIIEDWIQKSLGIYFIVSGILTTGVGVLAGTCAASTEGSNVGEFCSGLSPFLKMDPDISASRSAVNIFTTLILGLAQLGAAAYALTPTTESNTTLNTEREPLLNTDREPLLRNTYREPPLGDSLEKPFEKKKTYYKSI